MQFEMFSLRSEKRDWWIVKSETEISDAVVTYC